MNTLLIHLNILTHRKCSDKINSIEHTVNTFEYLKTKKIIISEKLGKLSFVSSQMNTFAFTLTWKISSLCDSNEWSLSLRFRRSHKATVCKTTEDLILVYSVMAAWNRIKTISSYWKDNILIVPDYTLINFGHKNIWQNSGQGAVENTVFLITMANTCTSI